MAAGIQSGKGLPIDETVLTPLGYQRVDSIKIGDILFDRNGGKTNVTGVFHQGVRPCFQINFTDRAFLITDDAHLNVILPRGDRDEKVLTTREIFDKKHWWNSPRRGANKPRVPAIHHPIKMDAREFLITPYVLGVLLGDGGLTRSAMFSTADLEILDLVSKDLPQDLCIKRKGGKYDYFITHKKRTTDENGYSFNCFVQELRRLDLLGKKSSGKFVPFEYKFSSYEQRLAILQGLLDTDGTIETHKTIEFYSISKTMAEDVVWLVESLCGKAWISGKFPTYLYKGEKRHGQKCYRVTIILRRYNPFRLKRKAEKYFVHENTEDKVIASIVEVEPKETICFTVDSPTETYIARGQVVTHNTLLGSTWSGFKAIKGPPDRNHIIAAPTYKILAQATLPKFLGSFDRQMGAFLKGDSVFKWHHGPTTYIRSLTDPNALEGISDVESVWLDEGGLISRYAWENVDGRTARTQAQIMITTTPYALNWLYLMWQDFNKGVRDDVAFVQFTSKDNPYFPAKEFERQRKLLDPRRFSMKYCGQFGRMEGLVYENINTCKAMALPNGTIYYGGIDWGFTNPFALVVRALTPEGIHYRVAEFMKSGLTIDEIVQVSKARMQIYGIRMFICDPSAPANILALNKAGLPACGGNNAVRLGIDKQIELFKAERFFIFEDENPMGIDEYSTYHYPEPKDLKIDDHAREQEPVKANDHSLDADRMVSLYLESTHAAANKKRQAKTPGLKSIPQDPLDRIEWLKRGGFKNK